MTTKKSAGKKLISLLLCALLMISIFSFMPTAATASTLPTPSNFAYNASTGDFTWLHPGAFDAAISYQIRTDGGVPLWNGPLRSVHIGELSHSILQLNWRLATLPTFNAQVVARRAVGTDITMSADSNAVAVTPFTNAALNQIVSLSDGTRLTWQATVPDTITPDVIYRIYANNVFRTSVDQTYFNLSDLNLSPGTVYTISVRAATPAGFAISAHSNSVTFTPTPGTFPVNISTAGAGTALANVMSAAPGTTVTLSATPNPGATFHRWEVLSGGFTIETLSATASFIMPAQEVTIRAVFDPGHHITVTRNNNALGTASANMAVAIPGTTVELVASPIVGNRFVRWEVITGNIELVGPESSVTTFIMPHGNVTVRAVFDPGASVIAQGGIAVLHTQADAQVTLMLPDDTVTEIIGAATGDNAVAMFDLTRLDNVNTVILPAAAITRFTNAHLGLEFRKTQGTIRFNRAAAASVIAQGIGTDISITLSEVPRAQLTSVQQDVLNTDDVVYRVGIMAGALSVTNYDGVLTIIVPYTGNHPMAVWRFLPDGRLEDIPSTHNPAGRYVTFSPPHLSLFVVGPDLNALQPPTPPDVIDNPFVDIRPGDWFYDAVLFSFANNLMGPTSVDPMAFSPNMNLNRAMIVTILHRREGMPTPLSAVNPFSDVPSGQWFTEAVIWAAENGIVTGFDGRFNPGANISRQDLAVVLMRYADFRDFSLPTVTTYTPFADEQRISGYAREAIRDAVESGIITGRSGNIFAPLENSTRAETAMMLYRFFRSV
ncbi:MAG: S-layer homology domain-containing protein [Oscillospiraceae bacterium]|nr:S-layer homology domain-containing protein [Oscillospiraceae bacterium]